MPHINLRYSHISDQELFDLTQDDDQQAFETLYRRHWHTLVNTAFKRLQCRQRSEDVVQEVFLSIYNRRKSISFTTSFFAYINQALKFSILNEIRADLVKEKYTKSLFFNEGSKIDLVDNLDLRNLNIKIAQTVGELPEKCKEVFLLSRDHLKPYREISRQLQISVSTVEKHMVKALRILRERLKPYHVQAGA